MRPQGKVKITWTPTFAYAIGLLVADGNLSTDGRHFDFTSKDKEQVITFKKCLGIDAKIGRKTSSYTKRQKYYRVQFGDVLFYEWLLRFGIMPAKSRKMGALQVPSGFFFDFLRGYFDGDSSIYAYWDSRWRSSYMYYVKFVSGSFPFLEWLRRAIVQHAAVEGNIDKSKTARVVQLRYGKHDARILCKNMYYSKNIPYLKRKFVKIQNILTIDDTRY